MKLLQYPGCGRFVQATTDAAQRVHRPHECPACGRTELKRSETDGVDRTDDCIAHARRRSELRHLVEYERTQTPTDLARAVVELDREDAVARTRPRSSEKRAELGLRRAE